MSGSAAARLGQEVRDAAVGQERKALQAEGRSRAVPKESLEALAIAGAHGGARVDIEPRGLGDPRALALGAEAIVLEAPRARAPDPEEPSFLYTEGRTS